MAKIVMGIWFAIIVLALGLGQLHILWGETGKSKGAFTRVCPCPEKHVHWLAPLPVLFTLSSMLVGAIATILFGILFGWIEVKPS